MIYRILTLCCLLLAGCAQKQPKIDIPEKTVPSWYAHPPRSSAETLYATGEGVDRQSAINDALNLIASNLSVTIASEYASTATETRHNGHADTSVDITSTIHSEVQKIRISNYHILHSAKQGFRKYIVLISADKHDIYMAIKRELDQRFDTLKQHERALSSSDALTRLLFYKRAIRAMTRTKNTQLILGVLEPHFDPKPYRDTQNAFSRHYTQLQSAIHFCILPQTPLAEKLAPVIREGISAEGIRLDNRNDDFTVAIGTHTEHAYSMGFFLARATIDLQVSDRHGSLLGSRTFHLIGQSSQSDIIAEENVAIKLKKVLKKEGIFAVLGLRKPRV